MRYLRNKRLLLVVIGLFSFFIIIWILRGKTIITKSLNSNSLNDKTAIIIWWTSIVPEYNRQRQCEMYTCFVTTKRKYFNTKNEKMALLFYGSNMNYMDLPLPRSKHHIWGLLHEESPKNLPYIQFNEVLKYFNLTSTFSRYSDYPLTTQYLENLELLKTQKYLVPIGKKNKLRKKNNLAPVVFVQSICDTMSGRDEYVTQLMKYIKIDSYGKCLNNKEMPESLSTDYLQKLETDEFYKFLAQYKFIIAYENGVCNDYITEKFWRPLIVGAIPIYFGSPTIRDWMPNNNSVILIEDFPNPEELAKYLNYLDSNDIEYNKYLDHKYLQINPISNKLLIETVINRDYLNNGNFFENFECFVCKYIYNQNFNSDKKFANQQHYDCGNNLHFPKVEKSIKSKDWSSIIKYGKCEANVLDYFLSENKNFTSKEFNTKITDYINSKNCF